MSDVRHVLVLPDREAAEEAAEALPERFALQEEPRILRDALAGEDDAEDASGSSSCTTSRAAWTPVA